MTRPAILLTNILVSLFFLTTGQSGQVFAQATLQPSTTGTLQQSAPQNQTGGSNLNQTGSLQNNQTSTVLSQNGNRTLGVVSNPNDTQPDVVVGPSQDLKTDISKPGSSDKVLRWIAVISFLIALVALYLSRRNIRQTPQIYETEEQTQAQPEFMGTETDGLKKPKKNKNKKRRKKPHQR